MTNPKSKMGHAARREALTALLFASPWFIGFSVFMLYPLLASVYYSFCDYSVLRPPVYTGLANYSNLLRDQVFKDALWATFIYAIWALPISTFAALSLALLLNTKVRGMTFYRALFYVPSLVPAVATGVLITWIFNGQHGVLNEVLNPILSHFGWKAPQWLGDPAWSKATLIIMAAWGAGNAMVIYLAGLQDVPQHLYEAADLDGANWWQRTRQCDHSHAVARDFVQRHHGTYRNLTGVHRAVSGIARRFARPFHLLLHHVPVRQRFRLPQNGLCQRDGLDHVPHHSRAHHAVLASVQALCPLRLLITCERQ